MEQLSGHPYAELVLDAAGVAQRPQDVADVRAVAGATGATDVLVLAHGWNNDMAEARALYRALAAALADAGSDPAGSAIGLVGVLWPSKRFAEHELIPGGAAGLTGGGPADAELVAQLDELAAVLDHPDATSGLAAAAGAVKTIESAASARRQFVDGVRAALHATGDAATDEGDEETPASMFSIDGDELLERLARPASLTRPRPEFGHGGAAAVGTPVDPRGGAAGLPDIFGGIRNAAQNLLNLTTYFAMKERAGTIGLRGVAPVLAQLRADSPELRIHLAGHSFGARVVTAAATGPDAAPALPIASMTLLQAAFSHFGFAEDWKPPNGDIHHHGAFRRCLTEHRVDGPIVITHTANDTAVGIAYALASRVAGQVASELGDENDTFGGIGRNGARRTPEARNEALLGVGKPYSFQRGVVHNLRADPFIKGHSDVTGREVAHALRTAVTGTR